MISIKVWCTFAFLLVVSLAWSITQCAPPPAQHAPSDKSDRNTCQGELANANKTLAKWAEDMENIVNESDLPTSIRESVHSEANKVLDMIEDFGQSVKKSDQTANQLARDLVTIRRRSNRMALDIYLNTFDMRWPQTSIQLGVIVERVQQACLDRSTIQAMETPPNPLNSLVME